MQTESLWFSYCRLLGMATLLCGSIATVLDQMLCALRHETTHWIEALVLVFVATILACVLIKGESLPARLAVIVGGCIATGCLVCLIYCDLCVAHLSYTWVLLGLSLCIVLAVMHRTVLHSLPATTFGSSVPTRSSTAKLRLHGHMPDNNSVTSSQEPQAVDGHSSAGVISDGESGSEVRSICDEGLEAVGRPAWARYGVAVVIAAVFVIYMVVVPAVGIVIDWWTPETAMSRTLTDMTFAESMRLHTVSGVVMLIFLCAGASIGSFLNVVIYRTPRKLPLLWPPSACPTCHTKLKGKDNIPVLAWLKLGGRCRYCNAAISPRYPIVEVLVAALFVFFYYRELLSGGANLPLRAPNLYHGVVWILLYTKWDLVSIYLFHMLLLVVLLGWGMINLDCFRVPARSAVLMVGVMLLLAAFFPHLNPTLSGWKATQFALPPTLIGTLLGCLAGALLGAVLKFVMPIHHVERGDLGPNSEAVVESDTSAT
ncbi:MAG: prepilin peptidase, partial [bacterium]|nr:prepilin peptidase [bacterium]